MGDKSRGTTVAKVGRVFPQLLRGKELEGNFRVYWIFEILGV